eukprot:TRINITY_DN11952_c0_g1_i1.p1 TRINITY_DN11952_c0_g1~~TRINITY_DN11952_c0_g1_i1.p1  ORF type:complete len:338 (-),score=51.69 TRINITY_DN11952_c0_g1_i1:121-1083(-)
MDEHATLEYTAFIQDREAHAECCLALSGAAGWGHYDLSKWLTLLKGTSELFVARRDDGSFAGCLLRNTYGVAMRSEKEQAHTRVGQPSAFDMFGMMLVDPACRGQGIAKKLLQAFESQAEQAGHACGLGVATADGFAVYAKRGYRLVAPNSTCCRLVASCALAAAVPCEQMEINVAVDDASRAVALEELLALDRAICGLDRGAPLKAVAGVQGGVVAVAKVGVEVVGGLLGTPDSQSGILCLGPILGEERVAKALIAAVGHAAPEGELALTVVDHQSFVEELTSVGFTSPSSVHGTMVLGDAHLPRDHSRYVAIINPCFG